MTNTVPVLVEHELVVEAAPAAPEVDAGMMVLDKMEPVTATLTGTLCSY